MDDLFARYRPYLAMMFLFLLVLAGTVFFLRRPEPTSLAIVTPTPRATATLANLTIDVRGAINKPGVYTLPPGSRVQDALALAGEATANANVSALNLARRLNDGEQLYVPLIGEATATPAPRVTMVVGLRAPNTKINLNTATLAELDTLPGIGPAIAQRIVDYRNANGVFQKIEDLKKVRGIGDALFDQLKDLITVQ